MKKLLCKLTPLFLFLMISVTAFTSCFQQSVSFDQLPESEQALALFHQFDNYQNGTGGGKTSYTLNMTGGATATIMGASLSMDLSGRMIFVYDPFYNLTGYHESNETETEMTMLGDTTTLLTSNTEGFQNGRMYKTSTSDGEAYQFSSPMSAAEYVAYRNSLSSESSFNITRENHTTRTCQKNEDGSYTATYTDFTSDAILQFADELDAESMFGDENTLEDMIITLNTDQYRIPTVVRIDFVFASESSSTLPTLWFEMQISDINASAIPTDINPEAYDDIGDLRNIKAAENGFSDVMDRESGYFKNEITQTIKLLTDEQTFTQTDNAHYGEDENGEVFFDVKSVSDTQNIHLVYSSGIMKTYRNNTLVSEEEVSSSAVKSSLDTVLGLDVFDIKLSEVASMLSESIDGKLRYTFVMNDTYQKEEFSQLAAQFGATSVKEADCNVIFFFENDVLTKATYTATLRMTVSNQTLTYILASDVTFSENKIN